MNTAERCSNCEEPITGVPVYFDGDPFCCHGCVAGGPCVCTYEPELAHTDPDPSRTRPAAPALHIAPAIVQAPSIPQAATADLRAPIPFRRAASALTVLHVVGMHDQRDLLRFAGALDSVTGLADVALTRIEANEAWLEVRAASVEMLAAAVVSLPGFTIQASIAPDSVEAIVLAVPVAVAPMPLAGSEGVPPSLMRPDERLDDTLLPPRPRFRVFRPSAEGEPVATPSQPIARPVVPRSVPAHVTTQTTAPTQPTLVPPAAPAATRSAATRITTMQPVEMPYPVVPAAPVVVPEPPAAQPAPPAAQPAPPAPAPAAPRLEAMARVREPEARAAVPAVEVSQASEDVVAPDARPGGAMSVTEHLTLVVYPFHSFVALNEFQAAIRGLRGISNTRVRRFYRGTLHLAVDYEDIIPLSERLQDLRGVSFRVVSESRQEIELVLEESRSLVAAGEG